MKTLKTLIFILFFCGGFFSLTAQAECRNNAEAIELTSYPLRPKDRTGSTSEEGLPIKRSIVLQPVFASIYNKVVSLYFDADIATVNVTITNETTGAVVYSEACSNPATLDIDLNGDSTGRYLIEIETDDMLLTGSFSL